MQKLLTFFSKNDSPFCVNLKAKMFFFVSQCIRKWNVSLSNDALVLNNRAADVETSVHVILISKFCVICSCLLYLMVLSFILI